MMYGGSKTVDSEGGIGLGLPKTSVKASTELIAGAQQRSRQSRHLLHRQAGLLLLLQQRSLDRNKKSGAAAASAPEAELGSGFMFPDDSGSADPDYRAPPKQTIDGLPRRKTSNPSTPTPGSLDRPKRSTVKSPLARSPIPGAAHEDSDPDKAADGSFLQSPHHRLPTTASTAPLVSFTSIPASAHLTNAANTAPLSSSPRKGTALPGKPLLDFSAPNAASSGSSQPTSTGASGMKPLLSFDSSATEPSSSVPRAALPPSGVPVVSLSRPPAAAAPAALLPTAAALPQQSTHNIPLLNIPPSTAAQLALLSPHQSILTGTTESSSDAPTSATSDSTESSGSDYDDDDDEDVDGVPDVLSAVAGPEGAVAAAMSAVPVEGRAAPETSNEAIARVLAARQAAAAAEAARKGRAKKKRTGGGGGGAAASQAPAAGVSRVLGGASGSGSGGVTRSTSQKQRQRAAAKASGKAEDDDDDDDAPLASVALAALQTQYLKYVTDTNYPFSVRSLQALQTLGVLN
ncbi:hypothetical protein DFJ73DRAFT_773198 [Zopfochytrium polystomum]|nr:hypothetical protein DFJ73DRAFT_773198 [Zopfochytrium polystomum]